MYVYIYIYHVNIIHLKAHMCFCFHEISWSACPSRSHRAVGTLGTLGRRGGTNLGDPCRCCFFFWTNVLPKKLSNNSLLLAFVGMVWQQKITICIISQPKCKTIDNNYSQNWVQNRTVGVRRIAHGEVQLLLFSSWATREFGVHVRGIGMVWKLGIAGRKGGCPWPCYIVYISYILPTLTSMFISNQYSYAKHLPSMFEEINKSPLFDWGYLHLFMMYM